MKSFEESVAGRILTFAAALPLATGACVVWNPDGAGTLAIIGSIFAGILLGIVGIGLAVEEHGSWALAAVLFLPPALLLYTPLVALAAHVPAIRFVMALAAAALLAVSLLGTFSRSRVAVSATPAGHAA